jgi:hypothetical protein
MKLIPCLANMRVRVACMFQRQTVIRLRAFELETFLLSKSSSFPSHTLFPLRACCLNSDQFTVVL